MREDFPYFRENKDEIYFDNASTTQKPEPVIKSVNSYLKKSSNVGRGSYELANNTTEKVEEVRSKIAGFIGAKKEEVVFTSGATESLNMIPWLISEDIENGQKILVSEESHDSTKKPWLKLKQELDKQGKEIKIEQYKLQETGKPDIEDIKDKVGEDTYLISLTHIHNKYGAKADLQRLKNLENRPLVSLDACQSIAHTEIDVKDNEIDFLSFSGHKMFADTGTGGLYINQRIHERVRPHKVGGGTDKQEIPYSLERGTPNISGTLSMGAAIDYIEDIGIEKIERRNKELTDYLIQEMGMKDVKFDKGPAHSPEKTGYGIISFQISGMPSKDVGFVLNSENIYVRDGKHCNDNGNNSIRVSLQFYNTKEEIDKLVETISDLIKN